MLDLSKYDFGALQTQIREAEGGRVESERAHFRKLGERERERTNKN
jgi:hypothetical protein